MRKNFGRLAAAAIVVAGLSGLSGVAHAETVAPGSAEDALAARLVAEPGGTVDGDRIIYPDGTVFVAVDAGTLSLGQCSSGQFCLWASANYTGSFTYKTGTGVTSTISGTVGSFWNNRSYAAALYNNAGTASTCYAAGTKKASVTSSYNSPAKVYLSSGSAC